jgi:hypothetical protein
MGRHILGPHTDKIFDWRWRIVAVFIFTKLLLLVFEDDWRGFKTNIEGKPTRLNLWIKSKA